MPPAIVTGTLQTLTSGKIAQGKVIFQLTNIGTGNPVGVSGTSLIPALAYTVMTSQDGTFTTQLWGNDSITPANTLYAVTFRDFQGNEIGPILYSINGASVSLNTLVAAGTTTPPVIVAGAVLLNPTALQTITGFPLAAPAFQSPNANPSLSGVVRLANGDRLSWRNAANTTDLDIELLAASGNIPADTLYFRGNSPGVGNGIELAFVAQDGAQASVAAGGFVRMHSSDNINWRNNANGADISLGKNTNDSLTFNGFVQPQVVAQINLTGQIATIGSTTLYAVPASGAGVYRVNYDVITTTVGTGGTATPGFGWNNGFGANRSVSGNANDLTTLGADTTSNTITGNYSFYVAASQNITYLVTLAGIVGSPQFAVRIRLEYLG